MCRLMHAIFHPEADEDLNRGLKHYTAIQPPLGRRHFRRPFPYAVFYVLKPDGIWVLAVMHFKQPLSYGLHRRTN